MAKSLHFGRPTRIPHQAPASATAAMNEGNTQALATSWNDAGATRAAAGHQSPDPSAAVASPTVVNDVWHALGHTWAHWAREWQSSIANGLPDASAQPADRRFAGPEWQTPYFALLRDMYLATARYWEQAVE